MRSCKDEIMIEHNDSPIINSLGTFSIEQIN